MSTQIWLQDTDFLIALDNEPNRIVYARIIEVGTNVPIEGEVLNGTINIDGKSAIRRTCSLSLSANKFEQTDLSPDYAINFWFDLEIGLQNNIDTKYEPIVWFKQGRFVATSFSVSEQPSGISISISGKDQMCLLNGELRGALTATHDFGQVESKPDTNGNVTLTKLTIREIIKNALTTYSPLSSQDILINDLDGSGLELWTYLGEQPLYYLRNTDNGIIEYMTIDPSTNVYVQSESKQYVSSAISNSDLIRYYITNNIAADINTNAQASCVRLSQTDSALYQVIKIEYNMTAGYHATPLVYNTDLILKPGETLTNLLDKIVKMLGDYEYFYNVEGQFVFQRKKNYIQQLYSTTLGVLDMPMMRNDYYAYRFMDKTKFTAIQYSPNILNIKNDIAVWGTSTSSSKQALSFHARWALNKKPEQYKDFTISQYDWRELIYQMALNKEPNTGYEQYYIDILAFWRELYNPNPTSSDIEQYGEFYTPEDNMGSWCYWNKKVLTDPSRINFWFEMLDTKGDLEKYSVDKIGQRTQAINDNAITSIYNVPTPEVIFKVVGEPEIERDEAYSKIQIREEDKYMFTRSAQGNSAIDKINELISTNTAYAETLNLTCVPIYYLQPNTRIYVEGYGDYTIDKLSYNLSYNGTMTINATKILKHFN